MDEGRPPASCRSGLSGFGVLEVWPFPTWLLKLKLQYFGYQMRGANSLKKTLLQGWTWERLTAGGEGGNTGWNGWMASLTQWTWVWANSGDSEGQGSLACFSPWGGQESDTTERLNNNLAANSSDSGKWKWKLLSYVQLFEWDPTDYTAERQGILNLEF